MLRLLSRLPLEEGADNVPERARAEEIWTRILADRDRSMIVAEEDGEIVGVIDLLTVPNLTHRGAPWAIIENLIVEQHRRRQGIGRALVQEGIRRARESGCYKVQLLSNVARRDAHHFYESLGFDQSAEGFRLYFDNAESI